VLDSGQTERLERWGTVDREAAAQPFWVPYQRPRGSLAAARPRRCPRPPASARRAAERHPVAVLLRCVQIIDGPPLVSAAAMPPTMATRGRRLSSVRRATSGSPTSPGESSAPRVVLWCLARCLVSCLYSCLSSTGWSPAASVSSVRVAAAPKYDRGSRPRGAKIEKVSTTRRPCWKGARDERGKYVWPVSRATWFGGRLFEHGPSRAAEGCNRGMMELGS